MILVKAGHMVNLSGPRPLGNSIESMDLGFALQSRCLEAVATTFLDLYGHSARRISLNRNCQASRGNPPIGPWFLRLHRFPRDFRLLGTLVLNTSSST